MYETLKSTARSCVRDDRIGPMLHDRNEQMVSRLPEQGLDENLWVIRPTCQQQAEYSSRKEGR